MTVRLPREDVEFAKNYAREHDLMVTEFIDRYLRRMRRTEEGTPSEALKAITGLVPAEEDGRELYRGHLLEKQRRSAGGTLRTPSLQPPPNRPTVR